jgi:hypothetical protein
MVKIQHKLLTNQIMLPLLKNSKNYVELFIVYGLNLASLNFLLKNVMGLCS